MLTHSESCERNKDPILEILKDVLQTSSRVLEIGTGTAQHAVYFAKHLPHLTWLTSDLQENIAAINARLDTEQPANVIRPIALDVTDFPWPCDPVDVVFTANTLHIISSEQVDYFFSGIGQVLQAGGLLCIYGPFKYNGEYTSPSNAEFDEWLKNRDPRSGIRDFDIINTLAYEQGLSLQQDYSMPANNQMLVWKRGTQRYPKP